MVMNCNILGCTQAYYSKGFCKKHYDKNRRRGDPNFVRKLKEKEPCLSKECTDSRVSGDYCPKHYRRFVRHGDPNFINPKCIRDGKAKERHKKYRRGWIEVNRIDIRAYRAARKERVKQATPKWANIIEIETFYRNCPPGYHVDHIEPIINKDVCGLHVIDNLQYLTAFENLSKGNKRKKAA